MSDTRNAGQGAWSRFVEVEPQERRALALAFACNFVLLGSYYILRPVRDAMATVFGVDQLQNLFTGTLVLTLLASPAFAWRGRRRGRRRCTPACAGCSRSS